MSIRTILGLPLCLMLILTGSGQGAAGSDKSPGEVKTGSVQVGGNSETPRPSAKTAPLSGEQIGWQVISAGGTDASSPNYIMEGTVAQTATGAGTSPSYKLSHGYWFAGTTGPAYLCGDADGNQIVNISDAVHLIAYIFGGGPEPSPYLAGDCDCNQIVNISDAVYLIAYIFGGGPAPCAGCK